MKNLFRLLFATSCSLLFYVNSFSQNYTDSTEVDTLGVTQTVCLSECKHFISTNVLQFATGTANLNYELHFTPAFSVNLGIGTVMGTRILFNEAQQTCIPGGIYAKVNPRFYLPKAQTSCMIQYGVSASYKYWNYTSKDAVDLTGKTEEEKAAYKNDDNYVVSDGKVFEKVGQIEHLADVSAFGKACIAGGLTAEMEVGVGLGSRNNEFYFTPNLEMSFGWTFGAKKQ
ncbi:MAG: hypothetical protein MJ197_01265 [Bacteroidales bacterium]|nr:hypothetical protein [Bacteroidales bacterium]